MRVAATTPALTARRLTKKFRTVPAVSDLSVDVRRGRVTGVLGPNGSGKTTTLKMALGLSRPTSGTVHVLGAPYSELEAPARQVGSMLDITGIHPGRTGRNHLRIAQLSAGLQPERVNEVLLAVGLTEAADRKARTYSLGMRQRLSLATALLGNPELLVLDEPSNGLDPGGIRWLRDSLRAYVDTGGTVILASHVLAEIEQTADDVLILQRGRLLASGPLVDVLGDRRLEDVYLELTEESGNTFHAR
jgi:ABC-2 type transport system ATP-binding protein